MRFLIKLLPVSAFLPVLALAQGTGGDFTELSTFGEGFTSFVNGTLVPIIFALAFLVFLWGVAQYFIFGAGDEEKRATGRTYMLYGIIGFVIMVSVWGLVNLFTNLFGLDTGTVEIPALPEAS